MASRTGLALSVLCAALVLSPVAAAPGATAAPPKPMSGHFEGTETPEEANGFDDIVFDFDVVRGRKIKNPTMAMNVICSGYPLYTEYVVQPMNPMKVNRRTGRFRDVVEGVSESGLDYRVVVTGRLQGKKVTQGTMFTRSGCACGVTSRTR